MGLFVRRVETASGATAVQIMHKRGRRVLGVEHIGSAHDEAKLAALEEIARQRLHAGEQELPLETPQDSSSGPAPTYSPVVEDTASLLLWDALARVYDRLGFAVLKDETFKALVLGRIIEPTSKVDTLRVLTEVGVWAPSISTVKRCLKRVIERDYRDSISSACYAHTTAGGVLGMVLYDLTVRHEALVVRAEVRDLCLFSCRSGELKLGAA